MGFKLKIEGAETIELGVASITNISFSTDTPNDSNARSTDLASSIIVTGKILAAVDGAEADGTMKLATWALVPAEKADCYRKLSIEVLAADLVIRKFDFPNAFVVDYQESYGEQEGVGTFYLCMKQKKDKLPDIKVEGGYSV
ncbi:MAG: membrane-associated protease 1 [Sporomusaceae bacterium]|nr:membrane-associated protease 1 [Sporomusaceae bacterium]